MKKLLFGLNLILAMGAFCFAQDAGLQAGTSIQAELQQTLDVKNARVGDQVVMKVTRSIKQNGRTVVEKGSKVIGRVTEVQQKTKNNAVSKLGVVFDRLQGQDLSVPISATIVSVSRANVNTMVGDDTLNSDISGTSTSSGRVTRQSSSNTSGGGLLSGATGTVGGVLNTTTNTVGGVTNTAGQTVGTVANTTRNTAGGVAQTVGRTVNGINIAPSVGASAQGGSTLSAQNKNLRLEKGATFHLQVNGSARSN